MTSCVKIKGINLRRSVWFSALKRTVVCDLRADEKSMIWKMRWLTSMVTEAPSASNCQDFIISLELIQVLKFSPTHPHQSYRQYSQTLLILNSPHTPPGSPGLNSSKHPCTCWGGGYTCMCVFICSFKWGSFYRFPGFGDSQKSNTQRVMWQALNQHGWFWHGSEPMVVLLKKRLSRQAGEGSEP